MDERLKTILFYGQKYRQEHLLERYSRDHLLSDWWESLRFFFDRAFYQGRRDTISATFEARALEVLDEELSRVNRSLDALELDALGAKLREQNGKRRVGKGRDIEMVLSTLQFIRRLPDFNIVAYSIRHIEAGNADRHYQELQRAIFQVGPKIASLYLRDVVSLFELDAKVPEDLQFCLQPIDTHVRQRAIDLGLVDKGTRDERIRDAITTICKEERCSPLLLNQGLWYTGSHKIPIS